MICCHGYLLGTVFRLSLSVHEKRGQSARIVKEKEEKEKKKEEEEEEGDREWSPEQGRGWWWCSRGGRVEGWLEG